MVNYVTDAERPLKSSLKDIFNVASFGSEDAYLHSMVNASELIRYARDKFDALKASDDYSAVNVKSVHLAIDTLKKSFGSHYDMWILDNTWDSDPLNGRSNAEMQYELYKRAGLEDAYRNNRIQSQGNGKIGAGTTAAIVEGYSPVFS